MPLFEQYVTIACVSNEVGGDLVGNALWRGVRLKELLERGRGASRTRPRSSAARSTASPSASRPPTRIADEREPMVAVAMNGEPLPASHGFPARLIVPGLFGYVSATKWLAEIELTTWEAFDAYWVPLGWSKEGPILTQSRIDTPRGGARVDARTVPIAGVAWAPDRGIERRRGPGRRGRLGRGRAERADLGCDVGAVRLPLGGDARRAPRSESARPMGPARSRPIERTPPAPDGARGHHTIQVSVGLGVAPRSSGDRPALRSGAW